ncbi:hypothetical protein JCM10908_006094 [Rhodotorula pacifica]|uniref:uncharacterized protein n=1 Tax=Rhodotorula pacifica TaxID=1495444 RepID=UPI00318208AC
MSGEANDRQRPSFVVKLHQLLSANLHPEYLHWINNDTFAVTSIDAHARTALAPQWEFNSLSSFIRQLSYYSFKRLSDRRRSVERRPSVPSFIVFTHPSGNFVRDDESRALDIPRKLRSRKPASKRKASATSPVGGSRELSPSSTPPPPRKSKATAKRRSPAAGRCEAREEVQDALQGYQLPAWSALASRSIEASPQATTSSLSPHPPPTAYTLGLPPQRMPIPQLPMPAEAPYPTPVLVENSGAYFQDHTRTVYSGPPAWYYTPAPYTTHSQPAPGGVKVEEHSPYSPNGLVVPPSPPLERDRAVARHEPPPPHVTRYSASRVGDMPPYSTAQYAHPQAFLAQGSSSTPYTATLPPMQQTMNPPWYGPS